MELGFVELHPVRGQALARSTRARQEINKGPKALHRGVDESGAEGFLFISVRSAEWNISISSYSSNLFIELVRRRSK